MSMGKRKKILKALKARGENLCKESANERVSSRVFFRVMETSLGKPRRLTGTLKLEISSKSYFSSPQVESSMIDFRA